MSTPRERILRAVRARAKAILRYFPRLRQWSRARWWAYERRHYEKLTANTPVDEKVVVFSCFMGRSFADTPRAIYEAMCADPRFALRAAKRRSAMIYWRFRADMIYASRMIFGFAE